MIATTLTITAALTLGLPAQDAQQHVDHSGHSHDGSDPFGVFLDHTSPAICTVTFILEVSGGQMDREVPVTTTGTIVTSDGLVMLSSSSMEMANRMQRMRRGRGRGGEGMDMQLETTPTDIRIMLGGQFEEYDAELVAKDSTLGLAFLQVKDAEALSGIQPISFARSQQMRVGEELLGINRLDDANDYAAYMGWTRLAGKVQQPRVMWKVSPGFSARGLPLFNRYGQPVGVLSTQASEEAAAERGGGGWGGMTGGGGGGNDQVFLIPAEDVQSVIEQARKKAAESTGNAETTLPVTTNEPE
ncbi:MAG: serine protease [Planctomycetota bacterium]|nr:serine protease [Planctomycetota bacterium]